MKILSDSLPFQRLATLLACVTLTLVLLAGVTGVLLAFYYDPSAGGAYDSLQWINDFVAGGSLIRSLHNITGNGLIIVALLQIIVMFLGRQFRPSWFVAWLSGGFLALFAIGLGWTAIILDWDQIGYWRFKIEVGIFASLPVIGDTLRAILLGGDSINSNTVAHMYTLHSYVLSVVAVVLSVVHLGTLVYQERRAAKQQLAKQVRQEAEVEAVGQEV